MSTREHLIKAKENYLAYRPQHARSSIEGVKAVGLSALEAVAALDEVAPSPYRTMAEFERSRDFNRKKVIQAFDAAIRSAD